MKKMDAFLHREGLYDIKGLSYSQVALIQSALKAAEQKENNLTKQAEFRDFLEKFDEIIEGALDARDWMNTYGDG